MTTIESDPIAPYWSTIDANGGTNATAADVTARLALLEVAEIDPAWLPFMAAAGAELAHSAGIPWRFGDDDPAIVLLRLIAKATITCPDASGPHTSRLLALLP